MFEIANYCQHLKLQMNQSKKYYLSACYKVSVTEVHKAFFQNCRKLRNPPTGPSFGLRPDEILTLHNHFLEFCTTSESQDHICL